MRLCMVVAAQGCMHVCIIHCICMCVCMCVCTCVRVWHVRVHTSRHPFFSMVGLVVYAYNHAQWPGRAMPYHCRPCQARPEQAGRDPGVPTFMHDTHKCTHIHEHTSVHTDTQLASHQASHTPIWGRHTCMQSLPATHMHIYRETGTHTACARAYIHTITRQYMQTHT